MNFIWCFIVNYVMCNWCYYIICFDWLVNQLLNCVVFELVLFCLVDGGMCQLLQEVIYNCDVLLCEGYQVILGVWEVGDMLMSFYNVIDVMFGDVMILFDLFVWYVKGMFYFLVDL